MDKTHARIYLYICMCANGDRYNWTGVHAYGHHHTYTHARIHLHLCMYVYGHVWKIAVFVKCDDSARIYSRMHMHISISICIFSTYMHAPMRDFHLKKIPRTCQ